MKAGSTIPKMVNNREFANYKPFGRVIVELANGGRTVSSARRGVR